MAWRNWLKVNFLLLFTSIEHAVATGAHPFRQGNGGIAGRHRRSLMQTDQSDSGIHQFLYLGNSLGIEQGRRLLLHAVEIENDR